MKAAGLIFDDSPHYIDHLAPLCSLMGWPLIVCEPAIADQCRLYYPNLILQETSLLELQLPEWVVSCDNRALLNFYKRPFRTIWLPHGLSDKGWKKPFFEALEQEDLLLVYGPRMLEVLAAKKIQLPTLSIGSYRHEYHQLHRTFYEKQLSHRFGSRRFALYAPTWEDSENNGTFWETFPKLTALPFELVIKLHPNTLKKFSPQIERCKGLAPSQITFLEDFPPIYPLLSRTDLYIGDRSSIGYDFLHFQKPLYFISSSLTDPASDPSAYLMQCGKQITPAEVSHLAPNDSYAPQRREILSHSFAAAPNWKERLASWI